MNDLPSGDISAAMRLIPSGRFLLTAAFDGAREGALIEWAQRCADAPPMVVISILKGNLVAPLIRDSHRFALARLSGDLTTLDRRFGPRDRVDDDPFLGIPISTSPGGCPIVGLADMYVECAVVRHVDIESDYELYVGIVEHAGVISG